MTNTTQHDTLTTKELRQIPSIQKSRGDIVTFDHKRIENAITKALAVAEEGEEGTPKHITKLVVQDLLRLKKANRTDKFIPHVETVQDLVEENLMKEDYTKTAKSYILYRQKHAEVRGYKGEVPDDVQQKVVESRQYFRNPYSEYIYFQMYSRWMPEEGRRETWVETVDRFVDFMKENMGDKVTTKEYNEVRKAILNQEVCPSMRLLWSAGKPCRETNVWAYNCSYIAPTKFQDLGEIMYILMCGAGLGFTVESENVQQFPQIKKQTGEHVGTYVVADSKEGWADAFVRALEVWFSGQDIDFDYSEIRPAGARLKTAGGRASGPQPLKDLMQFTREKVFANQGKRLSNLDLHDIICKIGIIVVSGGVRRSALISLSELGDTGMRDAKKGQFYINEPQRTMANNSAIYDEKPTAETFLNEWNALVASKSGERGIFNRGGLASQLPERRWEAIKDQNQVGMNPCGEIYLRSKQFCNLTSIVVRPEDTETSLKRKIRVATLIGTYQSMLTNFGYLSKEWKENCEEERLLGVSLTGYYDNETVRKEGVLKNLKETAVTANKKYAERFNINQSTAITCVKPHGNSGQLLGVGSGMHPWFSRYFIRRVRVSANDPMFKFAYDQGIPFHPEIGQSPENATTYVLEFPVQAPEGSVVQDEVGADDMLAEWKRLKEHFVEHNPSATIFVGDDEWIKVANFVYENWENVGGLSFLPRVDHIYELAPYEAITKEEYEKRKKELGEIDFEKLMLYETQDNTKGAREFACVAGVCETN